MTDKNVDILYSPEWDNAGAQRVLDGFEKLRQAAKQNSDLIDQNVRGSDLTFGENIVAGIEDATSRFDDFKRQVQDTAQEFSRLGDRALGTLTKIAQATIGIGVGSSLAFVQRFGATDQQAVEQTRATKQFEAAFEDLGRVASRFVTPALENLAAIVKVVADGLDALFPEDAQNPVETFFEQTIPQAAESFNDLISSLEALHILLDREINNALDTFATNVRLAGINIAEGFANVINGILRFLADQAKRFGNTSLADDLLEMQDSRAFVRPGSTVTGFQYERLEAQNDLAERIADRNQKAEKAAQGIIETNEKISEGLEATAQVFQDAKDELSQGRLGLAEVEAWRERRQSLEREQKEYDAAVLDAQNRTNKALEKLDADRDKALERLANDQRKAEIELTEKHDKDKLDALEKFNEREEEIEAESQSRREQMQRRHELTLEELAARGDVAGFIEEQKRYRLSLEEQDKTAAKEKEKRLKAFEDQQADLDDQYADQLDKLHQSGIEKENELRAQYQAQEDELYAALTEQLNILYDKHIAEQQEIERNFLETLANLDSNLAGLQDLRNMYYQQDLADLEAYLQAHNAGMRSLYADSYSGVSGGSSGGLAASSVSSFDSAFTPYASDAPQQIVFESGAIQNTVGDIATRSQMEESEQRIVSSIASGLRRSPQRTEY